MNSLKEWLEILGKALPVLAVLCLAISISYDWGYIHALDLSFKNIPTTLTDHVRSALNWISEAMLAALVFVLVFLPTTPSTDSRILTASTNRVRFYDPSGQKNLVRVVSIAIPLLCLGYLLSDRNSLVFGILLVSIWTLFYIVVLRFTKLRHQNVAVLEAILLTPVVFVTFFSLGQIDAVAARFTRVDEFSTIRLNSAPAETRKMIVLRYYDKFILAANEKRELSFISTAEILAIETHAQKRTRVTICKNFPYVCVEK